MHFSPSPNRDEKRRWYSVRKGALILPFVVSSNLSMYCSREKYVDPMDFDSFEVNPIDPVGLAVLTGYLTIKDVCEDEIGIGYRNDFPNEEIRVSWNRDIISS